MISSYPLSYIFYGFGAERIMVGYSNVDYIRLRIRIRSGADLDQKRTKIIRYKYVQQDIFHN
jgi:hypothetical protein